MRNALTALFIRELRLSFRVGSGVFMGVLFFIIIVIVIPFGIGPDMRFLARIGPAILWIGALLATLLGLDRLFQLDRDDGSLDLLLLAGHPLELIVIVKCIAHWMVASLPLIIVTPVLAFFVNLEPVVMGAVFITLLVGTPALTFIGAIGAALSVSLQRGGLLSSVLILPMTIPVLIFGVSATNAYTSDIISFEAPFLILCALSLIAFVVGSFAAAAALRFAVE